jgi:hypothetical protein
VFPPASAAVPKPGHPRLKTKPRVASHQPKKSDYENHAAFRPFRQSNYNRKLKQNKLHEK